MLHSFDVCHSGKCDWYLGKPKFSGQPKDRSKYDSKWKAPLIRHVSRDTLRNLFDPSLNDDLLVQMHKKIIENKNGCKNKKEFEKWMDDMYTETRLWCWIKGLLDVQHKAEMDEKYPWVKTNHWMQFLGEAKTHKKDVPTSVRAWAAQVATEHVKLKEAADKANLTLKMYLQHRSRQTANAGSHGWVQRDQVLTEPGQNHQTHFNFFTGNVADFNKADFGKTSKMEGLRVSKQWKCPYIFMDCPDEYTSQFSADTITQGLKAAMERTNSDCGVVVIFCQAFQIAAVEDALGHCQSSIGNMTAGNVIAIVPHFVCRPGDSSKMSMGQFPGRMFFAVVAFWGKFSSSLQQTTPDGFPSQLLVDSKFLATGLQDVIYIPYKPGKRVRKVDIGAHAHASQLHRPQIGDGDIVCESQKPLELYLYFLRAFQWPEIQVADTAVFDLCSGVGTGALAASYLGYEAIAVELDADKNQQAEHRMKLSPLSIHGVLDAHDIVFDNFAINPLTFQKPDPTQAPVHILGRWLRCQTFAERFAESLQGECIAAVVANDDEKDAEE